MEIDVIETPAGEGSVYHSDGRVLDRASYALSVHRKRIDVGRGESIQSSIDRIRGRVNFGYHVAVALVTSLEVLTLELEDGRWLDFQLRSSDGDIVAKSALRPQR